MTRGRFSVAMLLALGLVAWMAYSGGQRRPRETASAGITGARALPSDDPSVLFSAPGVTEPKSRVIQISAEVPGVIRRIHCRAGEPVRRGQLLVELDSEVPEANVALREALRKQAQAELDRLTHGDRPEERAIAKAQYEEAEALYRMAEYEFERVRRLTNESAASEKEQSDSRNALALATARRDAARSRWQISEAGARAEDIARATAAVAQADAELQIARAQLAKTRIVSPIDGIVIYRFREPGEAVSPEVPAPILSIGDRGTLCVRVDVDEADIAKVSLGQPVFATADAYGDRRFTGRVVHIEPTLGRKNFRTNRPTEKVDTKILEVVAALDDADVLPIELQMIVWFVRPDAQ